MLRLLLRLVDDCAGVAGEAGARLFKVETVGAVADGTGVKERDAAVCWTTREWTLRSAGEGLWMRVVIGLCRLEF
jgi:hypothetical protein